MRNDMKECMVYAKDRKTILCSAFGCMFSIGIAGIIVLPYFMGQWSYDRRIGPLHMILGGVCWDHPVIPAFQKIYFQGNRIL